MGGGSVTGHRTLIAARMAGYRPTDVWVICVAQGVTGDVTQSVTGDVGYGSFTHPEAQIGRMMNGRWVGFPEMHIHDGENAAALDLRPVVGTVVHLLAPTRARAFQVLDRLADCSPVRVIASGGWGLAVWQPNSTIEEYPA